jgi:hypothetical protein
MLIIPGLSVTSLFRFGDLVLELAVAIAISIGLDLAVAEAMLLVRSPDATPPIIALTALVGLGLVATVGHDLTTRRRGAQP